MSIKTGLLSDLLHEDNGTPCKIGCALIETNRCALNRVSASPQLVMSRLFLPSLAGLRQLRTSSVYKKVIYINGKEEFTSKVLRSSKAVVVDFHAE